MLRVLHDGTCGPGVCRVGQLDPLPRRSQHHVGGQKTSFLGLHGLPLLQIPPVFLRDLLQQRPFRIELSRPVDLHGISIAWNIMVHPKCFQTITVHLKGLLCSLDLLKMDGKRQLRRDHTKRIDHPLQSFRPDHGQRLPAFRVSHRKKQPRKAADMIPMIMCKTEHVDGLKAPSLLFDRDLRPLPAVDQQAAAVEPGHQRSQPAVGKRHHPAASKQAYV